MGRLFVLQRAARLPALVGSLVCWRSASSAGGPHRCDFEDSGPSARAFELAILTERISAWSDAQLDADDLLALFDLTRAEAARVHDFRRLAVLYWLIIFRPGGTFSKRNPPGMPERQAQRMLGLLG